MRSTATSACTFPELDERVNRLAHALRAERCRPRAIACSGSGRTRSGCSSALLAAAKLGAMFCPANWRQSAEEMAFVIDDLDAPVVIWQEEEIGEAVRAARAQSSSSGALVPPRRRARRRDSYEAFLAGGSADDPDVDVDPAIGAARDLHRRVRRPAQRRHAQPHRAHLCRAS